MRKIHKKFQRGLFFSLVLISLSSLLIFTNSCKGVLDGSDAPVVDDPTADISYYATLGSYFPFMLNGMFGYQVDENLVQDSYVRQMATPTPFVSGRNNTTYYITWNTYWAQIYTNVMKPAAKVFNKAKTNGYEVFAQWARLIRVLGMSRLSAYHGPLIYSNYGSEDSTVYYDSEETLYHTWFAELDTVVDVFKANTTINYLASYDASFGGDVSSWIRVANSLRLRLAIRISNVDPVLAKEQGEKAIGDAGGLITTNAENFYISLYGSTLPLSVICFSWNDTRMDAAMESFMVGLKDNRIKQMFAPVTDASLVTDHPDWPYKGIRSGAYLAAKDDHINYSKINSSFATATSRRFFTAAEVYFDLAEASLRGWSGAGNTQTDYETGVTLSFDDWGTNGVTDYLADETSTPLDYNDPAYEGNINDFVSRSQVTVKWNENATMEEKLEKIITQKWINSFTNCLEAWVDFRRTGYPKLPYNYQNDSNNDWGVVEDDDFIRRMPFVDSERTNNAAGVADAATKLNSGKDLINSRLWWDIGKNNFN